MSAKDRPFVPKYKGFDEDATRRAQATADRAQESAGAKGELLDADYLEKGPAEAARRLGTTTEDVGSSIERAGKKKR